MGQEGWTVPEGTEGYMQFTEFPYATDHLMNRGREPIPQVIKIMRARCDAQYRLLEVLLAAGLLRDPEEATEERPQ